MSSIGFQSKDRRVKVRGSEHALIRVSVRDMAAAAVNLRGSSGGYEWLAGAVVGTPARRLNSLDDLNVLFGLSGDRIRLDGQVVETYDLALNTAMISMSPARRLLTQVVAACEIHGFIEAANASWFADLLQQGLDGHMIRPAQGWEDVIGLAREVATSPDQGPIVMSHSSASGFPNAEVADVVDEDLDEDVRYDEWDALTATQQWDLAVAALRARAQAYELGPQYAHRRYGSGHTAFDLRTLYRSEPFPGHV